MRKKYDFMGGVSLSFQLEDDSALSRRYLLKYMYRQPESFVQECVLHHAGIPLQSVRLREQPG